MGLTDLFLNFQKFLGYTVSVIGLVVDPKHRKVHVVTPRLELLGLDQSMLIDQVPYVVDVHMLDVIYLHLANPMIQNLQEVPFRQSESIDTLMRLVNKLRDFVIQARKISDDILVSFYANGLINLIEQPIRHKNRARDHV